MSKLARLLEQIQRDYWCLLEASDDIVCANENGIIVDFNCPNYAGGSVALPLCFDEAIQRAAQIVREFVQSRGLSAGVEDYLWGALTEFLKEILGGCTSYAQLGPEIHMPGACYRRDELLLQCEKDFCRCVKDYIEGDSVGDLRQKLPTWASQAQGQASQAVPVQFDWRVYGGLALSIVAAMAAAALAAAGFPEAAVAEARAAIRGAQSIIPALLALLPQQPHGDPESVMRDTFESNWAQVYDLLFPILNQPVCSELRDFWGSIINVDLRQRRDCRVASAALAQAEKQLEWCPDLRGLFLELQDAYHEVCGS